MTINPGYLIHSECHCDPPGRFQHLNSGHPSKKEIVIVSELLGPMAFIFGFLGVWIVLNKWVLPRFGVKT